MFSVLPDGAARFAKTSDHKPIPPFVASAASAPAAPNLYRFYLSRFGRSGSFSPLGDSLGYLNIQSAPRLRAAANLLGIQYPDKCGVIQLCFYYIIYIFTCQYVFV